MWKQVAGWLGWAPEVFGRTPIPQIQLALDGVYEVEQIRNPRFAVRAGPERPDPEPPKMKRGEIDREQVARDLHHAFDVMMEAQKSNVPTIGRAS